MYVGNVEITGREVIVSTIAVLLLTIAGFFIASKIAQSQDEYNVKFYHAIPVADSTQFNYVLKTSGGDMFAYGTVSAVGSVTDSAIGHYMTLTRNLEEYRMHHRLVCSGSGKNRHCHTQVYWSWDHISSKSFGVSKVKFLGREFYYAQFPELPGERYVGTVNLPHGFFSNKQRYVYYGRNLQYTGTMYTYAERNTINNSIFAEGVNLDNALKHFIREYWVSGFWIAFVVILIIGVIAFIAADNDWLNR